MNCKNQRAGLTRRELLLGSAGIGLAAPTLGDRAYTIPGPYRGKVVEVQCQDSVEKGKVNREAVRAMMERGMRELTGETDEIAAWRRFFSAGDVVGIKPCLVGLPTAISQHETFLEIIRCLNQAGLPNKNIVVINRYQEELDGWKFDKVMPAGITQVSSAPGYDDEQVNVNGYDVHTFAEFPRVMTGMDANNPLHRRSHVCEVITRRIDKIINVCCLKDHGSAGITMALKNMSHGFVNNVCRTHIPPDNWCDIFIPTIVSLPAIRSRAVLHIGDALVAAYNGGPGGYGKNFRSWEHKSLFFATDPVAMDRVGWQILDKKRLEMGLPIVAETGRKRKDPGGEAFDYRQPEHILIAAKMGLGVADLKKIDHRRFELKS